MDKYCIKCKKEAYYFVRELDSFTNFYICPFCIRELNPFDIPFDDENEDRIDIDIIATGFRGEDIKKGE